MQIPQEWYIYVIPGIMFLLSAILLLPKKDFESIKYFVANNNLFAFSVLIVFSFLIGLAADNLIHWVVSNSTSSLENEILIKQNISKYLINERDSSYVSMAISRLLWISMLILFISSIIGMRKEWLAKIRVRKWILPILSSFIIIDIFLIYLSQNDKQLLWKFILALIIASMVTIRIWLKNEKHIRNWIILTLIMSIGLLFYSQWRYDRQNFEDANNMICDSMKVKVGNSTWKHICKDSSNAKDMKFNNLYRDSIK